MTNAYDACIAELGLQVRTLRLQCNTTSQGWAAETVRAEAAEARIAELEVERDALAARVKELEARAAVDAKMLVKTADDAARYKRQAEAEEAQVAKLVEALTVIAQAGAVTNAALNVHTIFNVTGIARAAIAAVKRGAVE